MAGFCEGHYYYYYGDYHSKNPKKKTPPQKSAKAETTKNLQKTLYMK
jgi:hypothetical protein